ncbi:preprotein translocase, SecE subunit [Halobacteroides halobius DSM 5150]|uniref:Protein translocase subunit SecE n=1 Tax=Halobacteroides halobius (strain ATCC 35273 / DSM 5150 / MD-1) TaxID=748449 RepID=L0K7U1_HALHC|nr:preprotein translocase subunit SecE [Halobacteroides halobius]AGB40188.1 preprotein translocase, SecE subunit [Halobacteroides halobius DSM 5150]
MAKKDKSALEKIKKFFREVKVELKKVNWPNQTELISYTGVVIAVVLLVGLFIGGVDAVFSQLIRPLILD